MDTKLLVDKNITEGKELLKELDAQNFPVSAALWFYDTENNSWRLLIATPKFDEQGPIEGYTKIQSALKKAKIKNITLPDIALISPAYKLLTLLKQAIVTNAKSISGIRFTANTINGNYIEDSYIYRRS